MEFDIQDGEGFWRAAGADTWNPFRKTDIVMECVYAGTSLSRALTYTAKHACTLHIRGSAGKFTDDRVTVRAYLNSVAYGLSTSQGYSGEAYQANIKLNKGDVFSVSCSVKSYGGALCIIGYID